MLFSVSAAGDRHSCHGFVCYLTLTIHIELSCKGLCQKSFVIEKTIHAEKNTPLTRTFLTVECCCFKSACYSLLFLMKEGKCLDVTILPLTAHPEQ